MIKTLLRHYWEKTAIGSNDKDNVEKNMAIGSNEKYIIEKNMAFPIRNKNWVHVIGERFLLP